MKRMLFNATYQEEIRVATVEGQKLINFDIETSSKTQRRGNVYKGVITRIEPSLEACFVDYGTEKQGFLPFKEINNSYFSDSSKFRDFSKLTPGTELIVQVEKDERGNKGAALTTFISLPGRYLVLMPNNSRSGGVSRRIDGEERDELKSVLSSLEIPHGMSIIARTAALGRVQEELQWDLNYLLKLWEAITTAAESKSGGFLIYQESNLVVRSIRDHFSPDISEILIDEKNIFDQAKQFMSHVMPNFVNKIKFYNDDIPVFSRFQIEHQIQSAYGRMVHLPSGGSIAIDHTEALTAIDVNSAKANKGTDIEATAFATNLEAAEEIARQMRLRDLGGLVVVDFIDMENQRNQREVENFFKHQLGLDRARIQMGKLSKFGLLELSRQRLQASLEESTTITCPRCSGIGTIRGTESTAVHVIRIIEEEVVKNSNYLSALHVQLPVAVATYLLNEKREDVAKIESRMKVKIVLIPNVHIDSPHYKIRKINSDSHDAKMEKLSYNLVEAPDENQLGYSAFDKKSDKGNHKAVVKNVIPNQPAPIITKKSIFGLIINKITELFNTDKKTAKKNKFNRNSRNGDKNNSYKANKNKTRAVTVNKSNNKIQTVRPNNNVITKSVVNNSKNIHDFQEQNNLTGNQNPKAQNNKKNEPRAHNQVNNNRNNNQTKSAIETTKPEIIKDNNLTQQAINLPKTKVETNKPEKASLVKLDKTPQITPEFAVVKVAEPKKQIIHDSVSKVEKPAPVIIEKQAVVKIVNTQKVKPVVIAPVVENTITHPVDLGNLELISTNQILLNRSVEEIIIDQNVIRYNDLPPVKLSAVIDIEYELVETKVN